MFLDRTELLHDNPASLYYGVAVTDVDGDGACELFVCAFGGSNLVLQWDGQRFRDIADATLADTGRHAIGVAAGDGDGDGREEIYVLNTDTFAGAKRFGDRLFQHGVNGWEDLFQLPQHRDILNMTAGRSVACIDRQGTGRYGFLIANYGGPLRLYEFDEGGRLRDIAGDVGLGYITGGRAIVSLPLVSESMDIFMANENSPNFLFRNLGDGTFIEMAAEAQIDDAEEHGRGIAVLDADGDGRFDLVYGNWEGPHRLFLQSQPGRFSSSGPRLLSIPSKVRTVLAADFDNDGYEEIFFHNIGEPNRLFAFRDGEWVAVETGEAWEPEGLGTGAAYGDFDGDGTLELLLTHGESGAQPLSLYRWDNGNHHIRIAPRTPAGAPARGAVVRLTAGGRSQLRAIDAGSGYLCQMEPIAHFGLGSGTQVETVEIRWPDGATRTLHAPACDRTHIVAHPAARLNDAPAAH